MAEDPQSPYELTPEAAQAADTYHRAGYPDAAVAGILAGQNYESGGFNPGAVNPSSKAIGLSQHLGTRKTELAQRAASEGVPITDAGVQTRQTLAELQGNADNGTERGIGQYLMAANDAGDAGASYVHGFERPGPVDEQKEIPAVAQMAQQVLPAVQQRYQQQRKQLNDAATLFGQASGPTGGGAFDHMPLPPTQRSPQPNSLSDAANAFAAASQPDPGQQPPQPGAAATPTGYDWGTVGSALAEIPRGLLRGFVEKVGLPADAANWVAQYYQTHPHDAAGVGAMGDGAGIGLAVGDYIAKKMGQDPLPTYDPNSGGYRLPLGTQDIGKAIKYTTGYDINPQDTSIGGETLGHMAEFVGAGAAPGQLLRDAGQVAFGASKTKSLAGLLFHHVLAPAGISGGLDAGEWAVDKASGDQALGEAVGIGARAALGGAALATIGKTSKAAQSYVTTAPRNSLDQAFEATYGGNAPFEKQAALQNLANFEEPTPGYTTPPALRTGSAPLQEWFHRLQTKDWQTNNDFVVPGGRADKNISAMEGMRPEGDAADAVSAVRNAQSARQSMIDTRIAQAKDAADQAGQTAATSSSGRSLIAGGPQGQTSAYDMANRYVEELRGARDDAFAHADDQWQVARDQGFTDAPAPTKPMYSALEGLMGDNIRLRQGADFPYNVVGDLYKDGNPQGMFSRLGVRDPQTIGQNQLLEQGPTTLEQLKGVDSRLGNAIRMEQDAISSPGNRGNPTLLRNLMQVRGVVWKAIDDGAVDAGNQTALRSAMDATSQAYNTFGHGLLARLLNERGGATNAPEILRSYLGNSQNAIQAADMFKSAMAQRTGAAAARLNVGLDGSPGPAGATPQQQFSQSLADWMRQDYLNTRADGRQGTGQKWLTNHAGFFDRMSDNPDFAQLHSELMGYNNAADTALPQVQKAAKADQAAIDTSAAQHFLGGDAGPKLDAVFKNQNPGASMKGIIQDTLQDPTGQAFKGLQGMLWDRVMNEAMTNDKIRPDQSFYSGKLAQKFLTENKTAFDAMRQADPQFAQGLDRLVATMALEDRGRLSTGLQLPEMPGAPEKSGWSPLGSLGTKGVQYIAARVGRELPTAGLQGPALASSFGRELAQNVPGQIRDKINAVDPMNAVRNAMREALVYDPEKLRALLAPVTGPSGQKWARGAEPWLQSVGVMLPQGWLNPQQEPGGQSGPQLIDKTGHVLFDARQHP